jgi:hypothetical protein
MARAAARTIGLRVVDCLSKVFLTTGKSLSGQRLSLAVWCEARCAVVCRKRRIPSIFWFFSTFPGSWKTVIKPTGTTANLLPAGKMAARGTRSLAIELRLSSDNPTWGYPAIVFSDRTISTHYAMTLSPREFSSQNESHRLTKLLTSQTIRSCPVPYHRRVLRQTYVRTDKFLSGKSSGAMKLLLSSGEYRAAVGAKCRYVKTFQGFEC